MLSDGERLKLLRKALNIKQGNFAEKISTTQGHISDIENGRKNLSDRTIKLICLENWDGKNVNETWLRTGEGEMFVKIPEEDETAALVFNLLGPDKDSFHSLVIEIMKAYNELSPTGQETICNFVQRLCTNLAEKKEG